MSRAAATGIGWVLWRRHRWGLAAVAALFCTAALAAQGGPWAPPVTALLTFPPCLALVYLITAFLFENKDLAARESGFPSYLWTLPVRTVELVAWPMAMGVVTVSLAWVLLARLVMIPLGVDTAVAWPAAMLAAVVASLQAMLWVPLPLPFLRVVVVCSFTVALVTIGVGGRAAFGVSEGALISVYVGVIGASFVVAARGVARARRGDGRRWDMLPSAATRENTTTAVAKPARPFASPAAAQLWVEWRRNGVAITLACATMWALLLVPILWQWRQAGGALGVTPHRLLLQLALFAAMPLMFAPMFGTGPRRSLTRGRDMGISPFMATRPLPVGAFIVAKLRAAALSTLLVWAAALSLMAALMFFPVRIDESEKTVGSVVSAFVTPRRALLAAVVFVGLVGMTWRLQAESLFVALFGRAWLPPLYSACVGALFVLLIVAGTWLVAHPESWAAAARVARWAAVVLCVVKLALAARVLASLVGRRLASVKTVRRLSIAWAVLVLLLFLVTRLLAPPGLSTGTILVLAVLAVPIVRVSMSPLALAANRHR